MNGKEKAPGSQQNTEQNSKDSPAVGEKRKLSTVDSNRPKKTSRLLDSIRGGWDISNTNTRVIANYKELPNSRELQDNPEKLSSLPSATKRTYMTKGEKKGEGTFGIVFDVTDVAKPEQNQVMKISIADSGFFSEILALVKLNKHRKTPNIPRLFNWFISDQLPPREGGWSKVNDIIANSSQFRKGSSTNRLYGYLVMENAEGGTLASFFQHYRDNVPSIEHVWYTLDVTMFQLVFSVAALPQCGLLHRDLGGSNNILVGFVPRPNPEDTTDWVFAVGDTKFSFPRPSFKPIMIDYGTANHLARNRSLKTDFRYTTLRYRAPELIFISDSQPGTLQPWYTTTADLFSIGMSILEIVLGDFCQRRKDVHRDDIYKCHPFMCYKCPQDLPKRLEDLHEHLLSVEKDSEETKDNRDWCRMLRKGFIDKGESKLLAKYLWGMYHELGVPNDDTWPGIESTHVWKLMNDVIQTRKNLNQNVPSPDGRLFDKPQLKQHFSESQRDILREILQYNPKRRPDVIKVLQSDLFDHLRAKDQAAKATWTISPKNPCSWPTHA